MCFIPYLMRPQILVVILFVLLIAGIYQFVSSLCLLNLFQSLQCKYAFLLNTYSNNHMSKLYTLNHFLFNKKAHSSTYIGLSMKVSFHAPVIQVESNIHEIFEIFNICLQNQIKVYQNYFFHQGLDLVFEISHHHPQVECAYIHYIELVSNTI